KDSEMADNMRHVPKDSMMHGEDGTGLASSSNQTDDLEDVKGIFTQLKISPSEPDPAASKGFTFSEVNCWRPASSRKLVCCNFSSDGRILASAGHENKVRVRATAMLCEPFSLKIGTSAPLVFMSICGASLDFCSQAVVWNMDTFQTHHLPEE
uniref:Anaphase-promoting complex subunit 4 WD40 domain-containing protein n=1 Tax=Aegilops tauschii subsp. strangulata TaxID=200361 RepID=A0A453Q0R2_AEGTS